MQFGTDEYRDGLENNSERTKHAWTLSRTSSATIETLQPLQPCNHCNPAPIATLQPLQPCNQCNHATIATMHPLQPCNHCNPATIATLQLCNHATMQPCNHMQSWICRQAGHHDPHACTQPVEERLLVLNCSYPSPTERPFVGGKRNLTPDTGSLRFYEKIYKISVKQCSIF